MPREPMQAATDVLVVGSGAAGMYAAIEAARAGSSVMLIDRSLIGRGGATVMAQMTVAVALGSQTPDHWTNHYRDTIAAGRGLCSAPLAQLLCEDAPACIEELDRFGVGWARRDGRIAQATAPGHDRARCAKWIFSTPARRSRRPCAAPSTAVRESARPATSASSI